MRVWGLIPARGGSKSIPMKNLVTLADRPLIDYAACAALASGSLERIICSTDETAIAKRAIELGVEVAWRPLDLASDEAKIDRVAQDFLMGFGNSIHPDAVLLVQPTSPFLLPEHIHELLDAFSALPQASSIHNAVSVPHNMHAWNQRILDENGRVKFLFREERNRGRNKQDKPRLHVFGNLIAARTSVLLEGKGFYAEPVHAIEIKEPWNFDVDGPQDLLIAEMLLASNIIKLSHIENRLLKSHQVLE